MLGRNSRNLPLLTVLTGCLKKVKSKKVGVTLASWEWFHWLLSARVWRRRGSWLALPPPLPAPTCFLPEATSWALLCPLSREKGLPSPSRPAAAPPSTLHILLIRLDSWNPGFHCALPLLFRIETPCSVFHRPSHWELSTAVLRGMRAWVCPLAHPPRGRPECQSQAAEPDSSSCHSPTLAGDPLLALQGSDVVGSQTRAQ